MRRDALGIVHFDEGSNTLYYRFNRLGYKMELNESDCNVKGSELADLSSVDFHLIAVDNHDSRGVLITTDNIDTGLPEHVVEVFADQIWTKEEQRSIYAEGWKV